MISGSIRIQATAEDLPTVIERDLNAPAFRIFEVSVGGELTLAGVTIQRGGGFAVFLLGAAAILNRGVTSLEDSIVRDSNTDFNAAIHNFGTLRVIRSIIADNFGGHQGGGILNSGRGDPTGAPRMVICLWRTALLRATQARTEAVFLITVPSL